MRIVRPKLFCFWIVLIVLMAAAVGVVYAINEPQSLIGRAVFRAGYSISFNRPGFLRAYQEILSDFNGGYLPAEIDAFLVSRLARSHGTPEWAGIVEFQLAQKSGRWGEAVSCADDRLKQQVIAHLMAALTSSSPEEATNRMVFIESLRRSDSLHKGRFAWRHPPTKEQLSTAIHAFQRWWGDGSQWPVNKTEDPLSGTDLAIVGGP